MTQAEREAVLQQALDGELDPAAVPAELQDELAATLHVVSALRALPEADLPEGFEARLARRLRLATPPEGEATPAPRRSRMRRLAPWLGGAAAAVLVLAVAGYGIFGVRRPQVQTAASAAVARIAPTVTNGAVNRGPVTAAPAASFAAASGAAASGGQAAVPAQGAGTLNISQRKIIENASMTVQVADVSAAFQQVGALASHAGGYIANSNLFRSGGALHANVTARVPASDLSAFTKSVAALGTVTAQGQSSSDVTQQYIDLNGRLQALQAERTAYLGLLQKATNVSDALKVQQALTDVEAQIESLTTEIQSLDRLSSLATVNVGLEPLSQQPTLASNGGPFGHRLGAALANSWRVLAAAAAGVVVAVVWALPWLIILAVVAGAVVAIRRRGRPRPPAA